MTFLKAAYPGEYEMLRQALSLLIFSDMIFSGFNVGIVLAFAMGDRSNIITVILSTIQFF